MNYYPHFPLVAPSPHDRILAVNRYYAGRLGMDPNYTISTNIARAISRATGIAVTPAKFLFHGGVAGFVAALLRVFGIGLAGALGAGAGFLAWLESFDSSARQH